MKVPLALLGGVLAFALTSPAAGQTTLDFDGVPTPSTINTVGDGSVYMEDGYSFAGPLLSTFGPGASDFTGSPALFSNDLVGVIRLTRTGDLAFDLFSVMIANATGGNSIDVTFSGTRFDGSTVFQTFVAGNMAGLQQFNFTNSFRNLRSVEFAQDFFPAEQYDDFVMANATVTPEPVSMALLGTGLEGLAVARRRRKKEEEQP